MLHRQEPRVLQLMDLHDQAGRGLGRDPPDRSGAASAGAGSTTTGDAAPGLLAVFQRHAHHPAYSRQAYAGHHQAGDPQSGGPRDPDGGSGGGSEQRSGGHDPPRIRGAAQPPPSMQGLTSAETQLHP